MPIFYLFVIALCFYFSGQRPCMISEGKLVKSRSSQLRLMQDLFNL